MLPYALAIYLKIIGLRLIFQNHDFPLYVVMMKYECYYIGCMDKQNYMTKNKQNNV